jgi:hypothetical protein
MTTSREAKAASSAQPIGCDLLGRRGYDPLEIISQRFTAMER